MQCIVVRSLTEDLPLCGLTVAPSLPGSEFFRDKGTRNLVSVGGRIDFGISAGRYGRCGICQGPADVADYRRAGMGEYIHLRLLSLRRGGR